MNFYFCAYVGICIIVYLCGRPYAEAWGTIQVGRTLAVTGDMVQEQVRKNSRYKEIYITLKLPFVSHQLKYQWRQEKKRWHSGIVSNLSWLCRLSLKFNGFLLGDSYDSPIFHIHTNWLDRIEAYKNHRLSLLALGTLSASPTLPLKNFLLHQ